MASAAHPDIDLTTQCDCGVITLAAKGQVVSMFLCACRNCQKATGTGHSTVVLMPATAISLTGATRPYSRPADSGATFTRHFCPGCGTTLYAHSSRAPALRMLTAGLFAGQNDWFVPNQLIFSRSHQAWDLVADHLPRHTTYRSEPQQ